MQGYYLVAIIMLVLGNNWLEGKELKPESELRPAWGLKFGYMGKMVYGLSRHDLLVSLRIPNFLFKIQEPQVDLNYCGSLAKEETSVLRFVCEQVWPVYIASLNKEQQYRKHINEIVSKQLPAIIPGFEVHEDENDPDFDNQLINVFDHDEVYSEIQNQIRNMSRSRTNRSIHLEMETVNEESITESVSEQNWTTTVQPLERLVEEMKTSSQKPRRKVRPSVPKTRWNKKSRRDHIDWVRVSTLGRMKRHVPTNTTRNVRHKRFISTILDLAFKGVSTYLEYRKDQKFMRAVKVLTENQKRLDKKIVTVRKDMMTLARASLKEFKFLRRELHQNQLEIRQLAIKLFTVQRNLVRHQEQIDDNANAIRFLSILSSMLIAKMERYLATYEVIISELDHFLDALDNLSNGLLSHTVISPDLLQDMINSVQGQMYDLYPEYELVLTQVHEYYNLPHTKFSYFNGTLLLKIPMFLKLKSQEPLYLFDLTSVPVPYHMNPQLIDEHESKDVYTWIKPEQELLAMSSNSYISLDKKNLASCIKISNNYFCEHLQLVKHISEHTCESAIYWYEPVEVVKKKCKIQYYPHLEPQPAILDAGRYMLLAGLPDQWTSFCSHQDQIPNPVEGSSYAVVDKADLCQCSIVAGDWYIQENLQYCDKVSNELGKITLQYTINMAVYIYMFLQKVITQDLWDYTLLERPLEDDPREPDVFRERNDDVPSRSATQSGMSYEWVVENMESRIFLSKGDKALAINNFETWDEKENGIFGFLFAGAIIAIIALLVGLLFYFKVCSLQFRFKELNSLLSKFTKTQVVKSILSKGAEAQLTEVNVKQDVMIQWLELIGLTLVVLMILYLLYKFYKFLSGIYDMNNLTTFSHEMSWRNYFFMDTSQIYILISNYRMERMVPLYVGTHIGSPELITLEGEFSPLDLAYKRGMLCDTITICSKVEMAVEGYEIKLPTTVQVTVWTKLLIWFHFGKSHLKFRLISKHNRCNSVQNISPFLDLFFTKRRKVITITKEIEVDDTDSPDVEEAGDCSELDDSEPELETKTEFNTESEIETET